MAPMVVEHEQGGWSEVPSALNSIISLSRFLLLSQFSWSSTLQKQGFTEKVITHDKLAALFQEIRLTSGFLVKMRSCISAAVCNWWAVSGLCWQTPAMWSPLRGTTVVQYTQRRSLQLLGDPSRDRTLQPLFSALATPTTPSTMLQPLHWLS